MNEQGRKKKENKAGEKWFDGAFSSFGSAFFSAKKTNKHHLGLRSGIYLPQAGGNGRGNAQVPQQGLPTPWSQHLNTTYIYTSKQDKQTLRDAMSGVQTAHHINHSFTPATNTKILLYYLLGSTYHCRQDIIWQADEPKAGKGDGTTLLLL